MADILTPILEAFETILQTNFNTEIDTIDSSLPNVDNDSIIIEDFDLLLPRTPWVQIFPRPGEQEIESDEQNVNVIYKPQIVTSIQIVATTSTTLTKNMSKYLSAMLTTIVKGTLTSTDYYTLDNALDLVRPISWATEEFINTKTSEIRKGGFIVWHCEKEFDPTS